MRDLEGARLEATARLAVLRGQHAEIVASSEGSNADDEHDPEGATIAFERQQVLALIQLAQSSLAQIERATSLGDRCEDCAQPIGAERLVARPSATRCIACASGQARRR
jgi:DnaK suppressor protein